MIEMALHETTVGAYADFSSVCYSDPALCDHIVETGELPEDWGDDMPPPGEFELDNLHYAGMLLLTLWRDARTEIDGKPPF